MVKVVSQLNSWRWTRISYPSLNHYCQCRHPMLLKDNQRIILECFMILKQKEFNLNNKLMKQSAPDSNNGTHLAETSVPLLQSYPFLPFWSQPIISLRQIFLSVPSSTFRCCVDSMTTASSSSSITNENRNARPRGNKDQFQPSTNGLSTTTPSQQLLSAAIGGLSLPANLAFRENLTENRTFVSGKIWAPGGKPPVFTYRKETAPLWALFYELAKTFQIAGIDFPYGGPRTFANLSSAQPRTAGCLEWGGFWKDFTAPCKVDWIDKKSEQHFLRSSRKGVLWSRNKFALYGKILDGLDEVFPETGISEYDFPKDLTPRKMFSGKVHKILFSTAKGFNLKMAFQSEQNSNICKKM